MVAFGAVRHIVNMLVFALVASLGVASGAHALGSETALRQNFLSSAERVGDFGLEARGMRQENLSISTIVASECCDAARGAGAAAKAELAVAERVAGQLADSRLGSLAGKISPERLQSLATNPNAMKYLDAASGHTNVVQLVEGRLLRITVADGSKIISVGPIQQKGLFNGIVNGRFSPLVD